MRSAREIASDEPLVEMFRGLRAAEEAGSAEGKKLAATGLGAVLVFFLAVAAAHGGYPWLWLVLPGGVLAIWALVCAVKASNQSDKAEVFFRRFAARTVELAVEGGSWQPDEGVTEGEYEAGGLHPAGDEYESGNLVSGREGKTAFRFAEVRVENVETECDAKGRVTERRTTLFSGVWFVADFNKHFRSRTRVLPDTAERVFGKRLGRWLQKAGSFGERLVELESPEFEKLFAVYSSSQQDARYLLSPSLMERLEKLAKARRGVAFAFHDGQIAVAIPDAAGYLERTTAASAEELAGKLIRGLAPYVGLVETLDLNTRVWTKE